MSGYTQEDIRKLIVGSERVNQMKGEINFIFQFIIGCTRKEVDGVFLVSKGLPRNEVICRVPIGEINSSVYILIFRKNKRDMSIDLALKDNEKGYGATDGVDGIWSLEYGTERLPLDFVRPVHDRLPLILDEIVRRFPILSNKIQRLTAFTEN